MLVYWRKKYFLKFVLIFCFYKIMYDADKLHLFIKVLNVPLYLLSTGEKMVIFVGVYG
jgi:hypothetical protein